MTRNIFEIDILKMCSSRVLAFVDLRHHLLLDFWTILAHVCRNFTNSFARVLVHLRPPASRLRPRRSLDPQDETEIAGNEARTKALAYIVKFAINDPNKTE